MRKTILIPIACALLAYCIARAAAEECRFAHKFSRQQLLNSAEARQQFLELIFQQEGRFGKVGLAASTATTYDGTELDWDSGNPTSPLHTFSAPSKESLHIMVLTHVLKGGESGKLASLFAEPDAPDTAFESAIDQLERKISAYQSFNERFPGYGGYLPWYTNVDSEGIIIPGPGNWNQMVPSLDNGENLWAIYALKNVLMDIAQTASPQYRARLQKLYTAWQAQWDLMAQNAVTIFYYNVGHICAVAKIANISVPPSANVYTCQPGDYLDDPYEGELFTWFVYFFGNFSQVSGNVDSIKKQIWINKRAQLVPVHYHIDGKKVTIQRGWCFSSHEQWKYLEMPYLKSPINKVLFMNGEKARTWNSYTKKIPGLFAAVNDVVPPKQLQSGYLGCLGIPELAENPISRFDVVTPYGAYPVILANQTIGLIWYHHMLLGTAMQGPLGSTESIDVNCTELSPLVTWDSKVTNVVAFLGGVADMVGDYMQRDGILQDFVDIIDQEWSKRFPSIQGGDNIDFYLPSADLPRSTTFTDFASCR